MKIVGARVAVDATQAVRRDLRIAGGRISFCESAETRDTILDLSGFLLLPGLINAHDHLEFNLFPRLGSGLYPNAKAWALDIYQPKRSPLREHLSLSKRARLVWGGLKNLVSGVTTVAHHNSAEDPSFDASFPVKIVKRFGWAHSLDFSPDVVQRFQATPDSWPFILHAAEGIDTHARSEIRRLEALQVLGDRTVLVHAIGLDQPELALLRARRTAIIWCPTSNLAIYGRTLDAPKLHSGLNVAIGTDSAITAQGDLIDEMEAARRTAGLSIECLYEMVTSRPAQILRLTGGEGSIRDGGVADILAIADVGQHPAQALAALRPEMVMCNGEIRLVSPGLLKRIPIHEQRGFHPVTIESRGCWLTDVDVQNLHKETAATLGSGYRLAGKRVSPC